MSYRIATTSPKRERAVRWGRELDRAMKARGVGSRPVCEAAGASRSSLLNWRAGRTLPRIETARMVAQLLAWPRLEELALTLRRKACEVDDVVFLDDTGSDNRRFCSRECQRVSEKRRIGITVASRAVGAERRLLVHQRAVASYCAACEPSGRCVTPECELRSVSPLPLYDDRLDLAPVQGGRKPLSDEDRAAAARRIASTWASYTPEERAARIARTAEASKRARGLVSA